MANKIFVKQDGGRNVDKKLRTRKHSRFASYSGTDGDPDDYGKDIFNPGSDFGGGTIIPRMAPRGGIEGDISNYGKIVLGQKVSGDAAAGTLRMDEFLPSLEDKVETDGEFDINEITSRSEPDGSATAVDGSSDVPTEVVVETPKEETALVKEVVEVKKQESGTSARGNNSELEQLLAEMKAAPIAPTPHLQKPTTTVKVKFKGNFGSFKGSYMHMYVTDEFIVLVYDEDAAVFSPPPSEETFTLSCEGNKYEVCFMGIEFDLPCVQGGVQVMIKVEE